MPKVKRKLNGKFLALVTIIILIVLSIYKIPRFINDRKLTNLGYDSQAIKAIYKQKLKKTILENSLYSDYLNQEISKDSFKKEYLYLYLDRNQLNEDDFYLYERLKALKGYSDEELINLFAALGNKELIPLCVFDKVDTAAYITDVQSHANGDENSLILSDDYLHPYENVIDISDPSAIDSFVSGKFTLGTYAPDKLVAIPRQDSVDNCYLQSQALEAFSELCKAIRKENLGIYAVDAYRSYEQQKEYAQIKIDAVKEGHLDAQTGLGVYIVSIENESVSQFKETQAYNWLKKHASEYGFIFRYPEGKESITGSPAVYHYLRFLGKELAQKVTASGLSYDEYYMLYLY